MTLAVAEAPKGTLQLLRSLEKAGALTPTSLRLDRELSDDQYEALGAYFGSLRDGTAWWLGDWLLFGEKTLGERYAQAVEATGRAKSTLHAYLYVAERIIPPRRREQVSWSKHRLVAPLEPRDQTRWLKRCERNRWSYEELQSEIRRSDEESARAGGSESPGLRSEVIDSIEQAARRVVAHAVDVGDEIHVPKEPWARLVAALGEER